MIVTDIDLYDGYGRSYRLHLTEDEVTALVKEWDTSNYFDLLGDLIKELRSAMELKR